MELTESQKYFIKTSLDVGLDLEFDLSQDLIAEEDEESIQRLSHLSGSLLNSISCCPTVIPLSGSLSPEIQCLRMYLDVSHDPHFPRAPKADIRDELLQDELLQDELIKSIRAYQKELLKKYIDYCEKLLVDKAKKLSMSAGKKLLIELTESQKYFIKMYLDVGLDLEFDLSQDRIAEKDEESIQRLSHLSGSLLNSISCCPTAIPVSKSLSPEMQRLRAYLDISRDPHFPRDPKADIRDELLQDKLIKSIRAHQKELLKKYIDYCEKLLVDSAKKLSMDAGKKLPMDAGKKLPMDAGKKLPMDAGKKLPMDAGKKLPVDAGKKLPVDAGKKLPIDAGKKLPVDAGKKLSMSVSKRRVRESGYILVEKVQSNDKKKGFFGHFFPCYDDKQDKEEENIRGKLSLCKRLWQGIGK